MSIKPNIKKAYCISLSRVGALCIECRRIPDRPVHAIECTGHQFDRHERLIRAGKGCGDPKSPGRGEPEPGIISRMADHDHCAVPELPAGIESFFKKCRTDTLALERRVHAKRCQCTGRNALLELYRKTRLLSGERAHAR